MQQPDDEQQLHITVKVPSDLHQRIRIQCIVQRRGMQDISAEAFREWLERHAVDVESNLLEAR